MSALVDLRPRLAAGPSTSIQTLIFLCPRCRRHEISVAIWSREAAEVEVDGVRHRVWHAERAADQTFASMSVSPSINRDGLDKCGGWHGFITSGRAQ